MKGQCETLQRSERTASGKVSIEPRHMKIESMYIPYLSWLLVRDRRLALEQRRHWPEWLTE